MESPDSRRIEPLYVIVTVEEQSGVSSPGILVDEFCIRHARPRGRVQLMLDRRAATEGTRYPETVGLFLMGLLSWLSVSDVISWGQGGGKI